MKPDRRLALVGAALIALCLPAPSRADDKPAGPVFDADGGVQVPAFTLPASSFSSAEALAVLQSRATPRPRSAPTRTIEEYRRVHDAAMDARVASMRQRYPTTMVEQTIAGVRTRVFTPDGKPVDPGHVLINIHGGGFVGCEGACSQLESIPIASVGGIKVVSVLYRMAPESVFPAGVEDVTRVYQELLKTYKPANIGIYGCSAGGQLTAETTAWLSAKGLPRPGAIGIFGAGAGRAKGGDSAAVSVAIDGESPPAHMDTGSGSQPIRSYFEGVDANDPIAAPAMHPDVLAKFPPTLLITSTRAADFSPAIYSHSQLVKAGVPGDLLVTEGLGHCYMYLSELPESHDTFQAVVNFFRAYLGH